MTLADLFQYSIREMGLGLLFFSKEKRNDIIVASNSTSRYLYDLLNIDNIHYMYHSIDSLYSTNSVNVYVPSDNQQFRYKIVRGL